jgi:hypothetical protein
MKQALEFLDQDDLEVQTGETCSECDAGIILHVDNGELTALCACGTLAALG